MIGIFKWMLLFTSYLGGVQLAPVDGPGLGVQPPPLNINLDSPNQMNNLNFALFLPNNDTVQVSLSFKLLTYTHVDSSTGKVIKETTTTTTPTSTSTTTTTITSDDLIEDDVEEFNATTTTTRLESDGLELEKDLVTLEEAVKRFREELIRQEMLIGGLIESSNIFYRHFKLQFDNGMELKIRCTYDALYAEKILNVDCYEFTEVDRQRFLANGELEIYDVNMLSDQADDYYQKVELVDLRKAKQVYKMDIH